MTKPIRDNRVDAFVDHFSFYRDPSSGLYLPETSLLDVQFRGAQAPPVDLTVESLEAMLRRMPQRETPPINPNMYLVDDSYFGWHWLKPGSEDPPGWRFLVNSTPIKEHGMFSEYAGYHGESIADMIRDNEPDCDALVEEMTAWLEANEEYEN